MLDIVLLRRRGAEARGWGPWNLLHVHDYPAYVAGCLRKLDPESASPPLARLEFIGGPAVGDYYLEHWENGFRDSIETHDTAVDEFVDEFFTPDARPSGGADCARLGRSRELGG